MKISKTDQDRLDSLQDHLERHSQIMLGYPVASDFDYSALKPFMDYVMNNVGDLSLPKLNL